ILLKKGWIEPAILWTLTVAYSGDQKTPGYDAAVDPLFEFQMDLFDAHSEALEEHKKALEEWQATSKDERGARPEEPAKPAQYVTSEPTIEALAELLEDSPRGLSLARDELDGWFQSFTRYSKGGETDRARWLELHRAGKLLINRRTGDRKRIAV